MNFVERGVELMGKLSLFVSPQNENPVLKLTSVLHIEVHILISDAEKFLRIYVPDFLNIVTLDDIVRTGKFIVFAVHVNLL